MMTLLRSQIEVLEESMRRRFELRLLAHLRACFQVEVRDSTDHELILLIRKGITNSADYGIINESEVAVYVEFMVTVASDFDSNADYAWAGSILRTPGISSRQKLERIELHLNARRMGHAEG